MQSELNTEMVLDVRRELDAILEANPDGELASPAEAAISSIDDALRAHSEGKNGDAGAPSDHTEYLIHASEYVNEVSRKVNHVNGGPFIDKRITKANKLLQQLTN